MQFALKCLIRLLAVFSCRKLVFGKLPHSVLVTAWCEEVRSQETVEIYEDHDVHQHHADQEKQAMVQPGVVGDDVPGEIELSPEPEAGVRCYIDQLINRVEE